MPKVIWEMAVEPVQTERPTCLVVTEPSETKETATDTEDSILTSVDEYLDWFLQIF